MPKDIKEPFRITVEHYDEKITVEINHSDVSFDDYMEAVRKITIAVFQESLWNKYFEIKGTTSKTAQCK